MTKQCYIYASIRYKGVKGQDVYIISFDEDEASYEDAKKIMQNMQDIVKSHFGGEFQHGHLCLDSTVISLPEVRAARFQIFRDRATLDATTREDQEREYSR